MKKWSEIKQATLNKLFLDEEEAQQQGYLAKFAYLANEALNVIANGVKPKITTAIVETKDANEQYTMPENFISFIDMVNYIQPGKKDDEGNVTYSDTNEADPDIVYLGSRTIMLPKIGRYTIYYNAEWDVITDEHTIKDIPIEIDSSILVTLPTYIASQLLAQDDIQRSTILKNEFELMLSRMDTDVFYQENHFKSTGGWY